MNRAVFSFMMGMLWQAPLVNAQQSEMFGPYELHYSVVNTTFLEPSVAATYGLVRGKERAILNLAVREHTGDATGSVPRKMQLKGTTRDLLQRTEELDFQEVQEGPAIYYIAPIKFLDNEWRHFEVHFRPEGAEQTYTFKLKHQMYKDL